MINVLLSLIPDEIYMQGIVIQGGISDCPIIFHNDSYVVIPMDISFHDYDHPYI